MEDIYEDDEFEKSQEPTDYLFACDNNSEMGGTVFIIFEKAYWTENGFWDDSGGMPDFLRWSGFSELMESVYEFDGPPEEGREILLHLRLEEKPEILTASA